MIKAVLSILITIDDKNQILLIIDFNLGAFGVGADEKQNERSDNVNYL